MLKMAEFWIKSTLHTEKDDFSAENRRNSHVLFSVFDQYF